MSSVKISTLETEIGGLSGPGGPWRLWSDFPASWPCMVKKAMYRHRQILAARNISSRNVSDFGKNQYFVRNISYIHH